MVDEWGIGLECCVVLSENTIEWLSASSAFSWFSEIGIAVTLASSSCFGGGDPTSRPSGLRSKGVEGWRFRRRRQSKNATSRTISKIKTAPTAMPTLAPVESPDLEVELFTAPDVGFGDDRMEVEFEVTEDMLLVKLGRLALEVVVDDFEFELLVLTTAFPRVGSDTSPLSVQPFEVDVGHAGVVRVRMS